MDCSEYRSVEHDGVVFVVGFDLDESYDAPFGRVEMRSITLEGSMVEMIDVLKDSEVSGIESALEGMLWQEFDESASYREKADWHDNPQATYY